MMDELSELKTRNSQGELVIQSNAPGVELEVPDGEHGRRPVGRGGDLHGQLDGAAVVVAERVAHEACVRRSRKMRVPRTRGIRLV